MPCDNEKQQVNWMSVQSNFLWDKYVLTHLFHSNAWDIYCSFLGNIACFYPRKGIYASDKDK